MKKKELTPAEMLETLDRAFREGVVAFVFERLDGTNRLAIGTLKDELLAKVCDNYVKRESAPAPVESETVRYFDMNSLSWKSFRKENLRRVILQDEFGG